MDDDSPKGWIPWEGVLLPLDTPTTDGSFMVCTPASGAVPDLGMLHMPILDKDAGEYLGWVHSMWVQDGALYARGAAHPDVLADGRAHLAAELRAHEEHESDGMRRLVRWEIVAVEWWPPQEGEAPVFPGAYIQPVVQS